MFLIRQSLRSASQSCRAVQACRATPSAWVYFFSSSNVASRDYINHGSHGAPCTPPESQAEDLNAELRNTEAALADLSQRAVAEVERRPEPSGMTALTRPQLTHQQHDGDLRRPQASARRKDYFRFVRIFGLSADMTLADILKGIAQTAPVGRVLHVEWGKRGVISHHGMEVKAAFVLFDTDAAAADLVRLAKQRAFLVRGESVHVSIWGNRAFFSNVEDERVSRVLHIRGPQDVEGFSEEGIRDLLMGNDRIVKALSPLGLDAEAVVTRKMRGGKQLIEYRFFSDEKQVRPIMLILRRAFHKLLSVSLGPDPCWNEELYPRGRTVTKDARHLPAVRRKQFKWPSVRSQERTSSDEDTHHPSKGFVTRPALEPDQTTRDNWQKDLSHDSQVIEKLFGKIPVPLDERQHERIAAWNQIRRVVKKDAPHEYERDDHQEDKDR